jgi:hypothetical protein
VAILPYLGQEALYKQFHLDEPWDSDHNHKLTAQMPDCFSSDKNDKSEKTTYLAVRGENTVFAGKLAIRSEEIKDGLATTIMVVQADRAVVWTKPDDFEYRKEFPEIGLNGISFYALFCDGAVRCLPTAIDYWQLRAMYTRAGGEQPLDVKDIPTAPRLPPGLPPTPVPPLKPPVPAAPGSPAPGGYPYAPPAATPAPGDRPAVAPPVPPGKEGT